MEKDITTIKRWKITGNSKTGFILNKRVLSGYDEDDKFKPLDMPHEKMRLKEAKDHILTLYPNYRIYKTHGTKGKEFWGFIPEGSETGFVIPNSLCKECDRKHNCSSSSYKTRQRIIVCGVRFAESVLSKGEQTP